MKCPFCKNERPELKATYDLPQFEPEIAYNIYQCHCGAICKENVWEFKGKLWIGRDNVIMDMRERNIIPE